MEGEGRGALGGDLSTHMSSGFLEPGKPGGPGVGAGVAQVVEVPWEHLCGDILRLLQTQLGLEWL